MVSAETVSFAACAGHRLGYREQVVQVQGGVPSGVVFAIAAHRDKAGLLGEFLNPADGVRQFGFLADNPYVILHQLLKRVL